MKLSRKLFSVWLVALLLVCIVGAGAGCEGKVAALKQTVEQAKLVKADVDAGLEAIRTAVESLPPDSPERAGLLAKIAAAEKLSAQIGSYITRTEASIASLEKGQIPAELIIALGKVPYVGPFVPLAAVLLPSLIAAIQAGAIRKYKGNFARLLAAWHTGPDLSPADQAVAEVVAGPKVAPLLKPEPSPFQGA